VLEAYVKRLRQKCGWELILKRELQRARLAGGASVSQLGGFLVEVTLLNGPSRE
jgi:hypothetical protein